MADKQVVDFTWHLSQKKKKLNLKEKIAASGWTIEGGNVTSVDSELCIYIIDTESDGVILFGCDKSDIPIPGSEKVIHWGHFVMAWDVIADASMSFDETHKHNTISFAVRALPGLEEWPSILERASKKSEDIKSHILVIVDRKNMDRPFELIVAHSESPVMNEESIRSIVDTYISEE